MYFSEGGTRSIPGLELVVFSRAKTLKYIAVGNKPNRLVRMIHNRLDNQRKTNRE